MHYRTLVTIEIPPVCEDEKMNHEIKAAIEDLKRKRQPNKKDYLTDFFLSTLQGKTTSFAREVEQRVAETMEPYAVETSEEYMEFYDETDELRADYEERVDCLKLPEGRIVEQNSYPYYNKYSIKDGKVYQKDAGPLHHEKRTKKAKKITALPNYPRAKVYKSFKEYADHCGYSFNEKHQAYGFYHNPNAMWDWYQIGGRWPATFLVKTDCPEYSLGERSWCNESSRLEAPEGYLWVVAARKKDICWDVMRAWTIQKSTEHFYCLEKMFATGKLDDEVGKIVEDGIVSWNDYIYRKGESLEEYLERRCIPKEWKYPLHVHDVVDANDWLSKDDSDLQAHLEKHIDDLDGNTVLVGVDYHM